MYRYIYIDVYMYINVYIDVYIYISMYTYLYYVNTDRCIYLRERWGVSWFVEDKADEEKASNNKLPPACWVTSSAQLVEGGRRFSTVRNSTVQRDAVKMDGRLREQVRTFCAARSATRTSDLAGGQCVVHQRARKKNN